MLSLFDTVWEDDTSSDILRAFPDRPDSAFIPKAAALCSVSKGF